MTDQDLISHYWRGSQKWRIGGGTEQSLEEQEHQTQGQAH